MYAEAEGCGTSGVSTKPGTGQSRLTACPSFTFRRTSGPKRSSKPACGQAHILIIWPLMLIMDYILSISAVPSHAHQLRLEEQTSGHARAQQLIPALVLEESGADSDHTGDGVQGSILDNYCASL